MTLFAQWSNRVCYISLCEINDLLEFSSLTHVKFPLSCQSLDLVWVLTECSPKSLQRLTHSTQSMVLFSSQFFLSSAIYSFIFLDIIKYMPFSFFLPSNIEKVMEVFAEDFFTVISATAFGVFHYSCCRLKRIWGQIIRVFTAANIIIIGQAIIGHLLDILNFNSILILLT